MVLAVTVRVRDSGLPWWQEIPLTILACVIAFGVLYLLYKLVMLPSARRFTKRVNAVETAAGDDPVFRAATVKATAASLFSDVQSAWDAGDRARLAGLSDPELMADWAGRMDADAAAGLRYRVQILRRPRVDYVGLVDKPGDDCDYVRVRIRAKLRCYYEKPDGSHQALKQHEPDKMDIEEYWTLSRHNHRWIVYSTRNADHGPEFLAEDIVGPAR